MERDLPPKELNFIMNCIFIWKSLYIVFLRQLRLLDSTFLSSPEFGAWVINEPTQAQRKAMICIFNCEKNSSFARFPRAIFIFVHFIAVLVPWKTWNNLFCNCVDVASFLFVLYITKVFIPVKKLKIITTTYLIARKASSCFASQMICTKRKMIAEVRTYIIRWHSRCCRRCP